MPALVARATIAGAAARLLAEGCATDFASARRKAAHDLGAGQTRDLPDNLELARALADYLMLFHRAEHIVRITHLREVALRAMDYLAPFAPRLVGPVLYGTACAFTPIGLQLSSDEFEAVTRFLLDRRRPYALADVRVRCAGLATAQRMVQIRLSLFDEAFELSVVPLRGPARAILSELDGKPLASAGHAQVAALLDGQQIFAGDFALAS